MPIFEVTDPNTGLTLELEGDSPPSEQELQQIFAAQAPPEGTQPPPEQQEAQQEAGLLAGITEPGSLLADIIGTSEAAGTFLSAIPAEVGAGVAGLVTTGLADAEAGEAVAEGVREALTFEPITKEGKAKLKSAGEFLAPVGEALQASERFLGDAVFNATEGMDPENRAILSAGAASIPTAILEFIGVKGSSIVKRSRQAKAGVKQARKLLERATPSAETLKAQSTAVFNQIDNLNASIKPKAFDNLVGQIQRRMDEVEGITPRSQPNTTNTINDMARFVGGETPLNLKRLENLRRNAKANASKAAAAGDDLDARLAESIADDIDNFLEDGGTAVINFPKGTPVNLGGAYKTARKLWNQAKSVEEISDMVSRAEKARSGFRPGLESEFARFLKNKKKTRFFKPDQLKIMDDFASGKTGAVDRMIHMVAGLSPTEGGLNRRTLIGLLTVGGGGALGGVGGATIGPILGLSAHLLSKAKATGTAKYLKSVIAAGENAGEIAKAYINNVPKAQRSPEALGKILAERGADLEKLLETDFQRKAADIARLERSKATAAGATGAAAEQTRNQTPQLIGAP